MLKKTIIALSVVLLFSNIASAVIIAKINDPNDGHSLAKIIEEEGIIVGDKLFDNFIVSTAKSEDAVAPDEDAITVFGILLDGELGLRFTGGWTAGGGQVADTTLIFHVTADEPWLIHDNSLWMDGYGAESGGMASITENVFASNPLEGYTPSLADKYVYYVGPNNKQLYDHKEFTDAEGNPIALPEIWVVKDIVVAGGSPTEPGGASISQFYQTFSQIPEPGTVALVLLGSLFGLSHRKRTGH